jgi:hypothetical protein
VLGQKHFFGADIADRLKSIGAGRLACSLVRGVGYLRDHAFNVTRRSIVFFFVWLLYACWPAIAQAETPSDAPIRLPVKVGNATLSFVLDTGASTHAARPQHLDEIGQRVGKSHVESSSGVSSEEFYRTSSLMVAGAISPSAYAIALDDQREEHRRILNGFDAGVDGILGCPILYMGAWRIEFGESARIIGSSGDSISFVDNLYLSLDRFGRAYTRDVEIGGFSQFMLFDTGFSGGVKLNTPFFDGLLTGGMLKLTGTADMGTINGIRKVRHGVLRTMKFGVFELRDVPVQESGSNAIGMQFLRNIDFVIDINEQDFKILRARPRWTLDGRSVEATISVEKIGQVPTGN